MATAVVRSGNQGPRVATGAMDKSIGVEAAIARIPPGAVLMIGGFMSVGAPQVLIEELLKQRTGDLTVIANDTGSPGKGIGRLVAAGLVRRVIASHIGTNPETQRLMNAGEIAVDLVPQGTLAERIRAAGAGLGGFLTPTGIGTVTAEGKQTIDVGGRGFLLELPLRADFALVSAFRGDRWGNLLYKGTARNFNPVMATAAAVVVAEVQELYETGDLDPERIETPGIYVDMVVEA